MSTISSDVSAPAVIDEDDYAVLEKWHAATQRKQITLVTAG